MAVDKTLHILFTFADKGFLPRLDKTRAFCKENGIPLKVFIDSGAFSVKYGKAEITLDSWMKFCHEHGEGVDIYACLDVVDDWKKTVENQRIMESEGLSPLPVIQYGMPLREAIKYAEKYDYVALGCIHNDNWKDRYSYTKYVVAACQSVKPDIRFHGFGIHAMSRAKAFPWYSVDSVAWKYGDSLRQIFLFDSKRASLIKLDLGASKRVLKQWGYYRSLLSQYSVPTFSPSSWRVPGFRQHLCSASIESLTEMSRHLQQTLPSDYHIYFSSFDLTKVHESMLIKRFARKVQ